MTKSLFVTATVKKILRFEIEKSFKTVLRRLLVSQKSSFFFSRSTLKRISWICIYRTLNNQIPSENETRRGSRRGQKFRTELVLSGLENLVLSFEKKWSELCQGSLRKVQVLEINGKYFRSPKKQRSFCLNLWWTGFKNFSKIQQFQLFIRISFRAIEEPFPYRIWSAALLVHYLEVSFEEF